MRAADTALLSAIPVRCQLSPGELMQQSPDLCSQRSGDDADLISSPLDRIAESRLKVVAKLLFQERQVWRV